MPTLAIIQNQHGYFLDVQVEFDQNKLINATVYRDLDAGLQAFNIRNELDEDDGAYIPELFKAQDGELYITGANTCTGDPEDADVSIADIINNYEF
jgi:hypothetical protein